MATISVGDLTPRNQYTATSGQTVFAYSFPIFVNTDLKVYNGSTLLTLTTHYTVSGAATDNGGNVTLGSGATVGDIITIYRDMPVARTSDYQTNGDLRAETLNDDLDKLAMMIQQIEYDLNSRTLRFGQFTTGIPLSEFTESATDRAGKVLSFDSSGDPNITQELGVFKGNWAASTAFVLRDIVKDTSNSNVYICTTAHTSSGSQPISSNTDAAKWALLVDAASATTSATAAATSATAAASSATAAASSATAAATSKTGADTAKTAAETAKTAAETAETNAETAETNAETAETNAETAEAAAVVSKNAAATSATAAASSATSAASSASTATTKASEASSSASTASGHKDTATTKASEAASSATGAASSATTATTKASESASSATAAAASATAAAASADNFDDVYLGAKSSDPTVDNDGDALTAGDIYFNTTSNVTKVYNGSSWQVTVTDLSGVLATSGGTMTGNTIHNDNVKALFGTGSDLEIFHDGDNSYIHDNGTGILLIRGGTTLRITSGANEYHINCTDDAGVELFHNNVKKFETTANGVTVTGGAVGTMTTDNDGSFAMSASNNFKCTPTGNFTLTFTSIVAQSGNILLVNSGGHTVAAHANTKVDANLLATVSTAGTYLLSYFSDGTNVYMTNSAIYT
jgi:hypothetical protein